MTEKLEEQTEEITTSGNSESANSPDSDNSQDFANPQNLSGINSTSENNDKGPGSHNGNAPGSNNESDSSVESDNGTGSNNDDDSPDTFPREYVEKLRDENAKYRQRAQRADTLAQRLHEALVAATGRLQDPSDLAFNEEHLDDPEALQAAIEDLLARKPHLASRRPLGDIGQGVTNGNTGDVDLAALLRSRA